MTAKLQETETRLATCEGYIDKVKKDIVKTEQLIQEKKDAVKVTQSIYIFTLFLFRLLQRKLCKCILKELK